MKEEFSDVSSIKAHLEQWKFSFPASYSQAYLSFCLPKLFSPFARLELLSWNPLKDDGGVLEDARWFNVLMFYGFLEGTEPDRDDEDILLIPNIVEKAVLPKLTGEITFDHCLECLPHYPPLSPPFFPTIHHCLPLSSPLSSIVSPFLPHYPPLSPPSSPLSSTLSPFIPHYHPLYPPFFPTILYSLPLCFKYQYTYRCCIIKCA